MRLASLFRTCSPIGVSLAILCTWFTATSLAAPPAKDPAQSAPASPEEVAAAQRANGEFAIDLYRRLAAEHPTGNIFLSPFSAATALTIAAEGAIDETARQLDSVLHLPATARHADAAPALGWVHRAQAALAAAAAPPEVPEATRAKIADLKARLEDANRASSQLQKTGKFGDSLAAGETARRLAYELNQLLETVDLYELRIANALWAEKTHPFRQQYIGAIQAPYGAVLHAVDFKRNFEPARREINSWVERQTNERIRDLIPSGALDTYTRLVITNAIYFKGEWAEPFKESSTRTSPFRHGGGGGRQLPLMHQLNRETASYGAGNANGSLFNTPMEIPLEMEPTDPSLYPDERGFTLVALPYKGRKLSMVWLLPRSPAGVPALERLLTHERLQVWLRHLESRAVDIHVPKYKLETNYSLSGALQGLGMVRAFRDPGRHPQGAEFDAMTASRDPQDRLYISEVIQKTFLEVNEKGTEAAAATAVIMSATMAAIRQEEPRTKPFIPIFMADHPFLFLIRDNATGTILFLGRFTG